MIDVKPFNTIMVTHSSFPKAKSAPNTSASVYLFPSFTWFPAIPLDPTSLQDFVQGFLLPENASRGHSNPLGDGNATLVRHTPFQGRFDRQQIQVPTVLICGHAARDQRCGIMGPVLYEQFLNIFKKRVIPAWPDGITERPQPQVALISHIGGHKFAGNVIVYIPPGLLLIDKGHHPLAGKGIWYGRVGPKHVEGIIDETILKGKVIKELFRGGVGQGGQYLRL